MEKTDKEKRIAKFLEGYGELVEVYRVDFGHQPVYATDGAGGYKTIIQVMPIDLDELAATQKAQEEKKSFIAK